MQSANSRAKIVDELYKISKMGMEASEIILPDVKHEELRAQIVKQDKNYQSIAEKSKDILVKIGNEPTEKSGITKQMLRGSIKMNTLFNKNPQHIAELMISGTTMGIIDMTKAINRFPDDDVQNRKLAEEYIDTEQKNIESLKKFL